MNFIKNIIFHLFLHFSSQDFLDIQVVCVFCSLFDKVTARFYLVAHERIEGKINFRRILFIEHNAAQNTAFRVHGGLPELLRIHLSQSFVTLDLIISASDLIEDLIHLIVVVCVPYFFVFLNLEAIEAGIADKEKQDAIFTWLNGERLIESDTSKGSDIYAYGFAPRNTTVPAQDKWWDYLGGNLPLSAAGGYNQYYQNGGASLYTEYYDIMARAQSGRTAEAYNRMLTLATAYADGSLASSDSAACSISSNALSGLTPTSILRTLFGLDTDGIRLYISPDTQMLDLASAGNSAENSSETSISTYGVRGIGFAKNTYGFLFDDDTVYITAVSKKPVRISIGSLQPNTEYELALRVHLKLKQQSLLPIMQALWKLRLTLEVRAM